MRAEGSLGRTGIGGLASWLEPFVYKSYTNRKEDAPGQESCDPASLKWRRIRIATNFHHTVVHGLHLCTPRKKGSEIGCNFALCLGLLSARNASFFAFQQRTYVESDKHLL